MNKVFAIGALGGSGTRAVAQILMDAGVFMGSDFSNQKDNILFTSLFRNPSWKKQATTEEIEYRIRVFDKIMSGKTLNVLEVNELNIAIKSNKTYPTADKKRRKYIFEHYTKSNGRHAIWGFKEPNSHIYLENLNEHFKSFKYVHVLRHGLDMAFARNLKQLNNWGPIFGIELTGKENETELAVLQLDYWIAATRATLNLGNSMGDRFLLVKHQDSYLNPKKFVKNLFSFLDISIDKEMRNTLASIPKTPESKDRFLNYGIEIFRDDQLQFVKDLGFTF